MLPLAYTDVPAIHPGVHVAGDMIQIAAVALKEF
jgi:hypothetical protein